MWRVPSICALLVTSVFVVLTWTSAVAQRRDFYGGRLNAQQLVRRIEQLERRVTLLERARADGPPTPQGRIPSPTAVRPEAPAATPLPRR